MIACHAPNHRSGQPAAYELTYTTPPIVGRNAAPGLAFTAGVCGPCRDVWASAIEAEGGRVTGLRALDAPVGRG